MTTNTCFSAYFDVKDNPKRLGHMKGVRGLDLDFFISSKNHKLLTAKHIQLNKDNLPALKYMNNLRNYCFGKKYVFTKFGKQIKGRAFFELSSIWCSKILLFKEIKKLASTDFITWLDCRDHHHKKKILKYRYKKLNAEAYRRTRLPEKPYRGLLTHEVINHRPWMHASVLKMPIGMVDEIIGKYTESLLFADRNFEIYDEEAVLAHMASRDPGLFYIHELGLRP
jgi:hypothetical protein